MKFVIKETEPTFDANIKANKKPCNNAEELEYTHTFGRRIRDENGHPITQIHSTAVKCWTVELNSLEDVFKLMDELETKYKVKSSSDAGLIFFSEKHESGLPEIEIYNAYRE